jgi:hypothetical protein
VYGLIAQQLSSSGTIFFGPYIQAPPLSLALNSMSIDPERRPDVATTRPSTVPSAVREASGPPRRRGGDCPPAVIIVIVMAWIMIMARIVLWNIHFLFLC